MRFLATIVFLLFAALGIWGLYGFGGETLPEQIMRHTGMSFRSAALVTTIAVSFLGGLEMLLWTMRGKRPRDQTETDKHD